MFSNRRLVWIFLFYIIFWLLFSIAYYIIHQSDPNSFVFNKEILESRRIDYKSDIKARIQYFDKEIDFLYSFLDALENETDDSLIIEKHNEVQGPEVYLSPGFVGMNKTSKIKINKRISEIKNEKKSYIEKLHNNDKWESSEAWGYIDFMYFSLVTQTTLGYGDIMPNNRLVRGVVTFQLIISLILVVFFVSAHKTIKMENKGSRRREI